MAILLARRPGPVEILSAVGAEGINEVYRTCIARLDHLAAIRILRAYLAARSELRERFEREAQAITSLGHPHICTLCEIAGTLTWRETKYGDALT
jgi:serine/threonine protein kinase